MHDLPFRFSYSFFIKRHIEFFCHFKYVKSSLVMQAHIIKEHVDKDVENSNEVLRPVTESKHKCEFCSASFLREVFLRFVAFTILYSTF